MRKVNAAISYKSSRHINNQVENSNEPCKYSHKFFQNFTSSSPPETGSFSKWRDTTNSIFGDSQKDPPSDSSHNQNEPIENNTDVPSSPKDFSSLSTVMKSISLLLLYLLSLIAWKKKDKLMVIRWDFLSSQNQHSFASCHSVDDSLY